MTENRVTVKYLGKKEGLVLKLKYLSETVSFDNSSKTADMLPVDARELITRCPNGYEVVVGDATLQKAEENIFSDQGLDGDNISLEANNQPEGDEKPEDDGGMDEDEKQVAILESLQAYLESLPDNTAIVEYCEGTYGIADLNRRRKTENLIQDAIKAISRTMAPTAQTDE